MVNDTGAGIFTAKQDRPLFSVVGKRCCSLIGDLTHCITFNTNGKPCLVHHREHVHQSTIFFTNQIAYCAVVIAKRHNAGRAGMNTQLMLNRYTKSIVALIADLTIRIDHEFWHDKQ